MSQNTENTRLAAMANQPLSKAIEENPVGNGPDAFHAFVQIDL